MFVLGKPMQGLSASNRRLGARRDFVPRKQLVASCHGRFTGAALGESCYQMILAMPQLADACHWARIN